MRLTGGLGPALTREAMADFPLDSLVAVIFHGRPGTPMPPWKAMLSEDEARWIALRLHWAISRTRRSSIPATAFSPSSLDVMVRSPA